MNGNGQSGPKTLYEKLYEKHIAYQNKNGTVLLYIDRHLIHEVSSPQAFTGLDTHERSVRCPQLTLATCDHNVPTTPRPRVVNASQARIQVDTLIRNVQKHQIPYLGLNSSSQGIVHVIGPELGFTLPGTTVVCGDSHTSTHGAFGCLAFGIGTSEVEHVLATQTILTKKWKSIRVWVEGELANGVGAKDLILHIVGSLGTACGAGAAIEFAGPTIEALDMEARMTVCNMAIEAGARAGLIAPDSTTCSYLEDRPLAPRGQDWLDAVDYWTSLKSDERASFDSEFRIDATEVSPIVSWGTSPEQVVPITGCVPAPDSFSDPVKAESCRKALVYMGLHPGTQMKDIAIDKIFIGSCTNSRLSDLRAAASIVHGRKIARSIKSAYVVPGSGLVKRQAEEEGLDVIFKAAGFEWREPGCSMCVGLNEDQLDANERSASTSNRNFENRQGFAGRTHLVSPSMAAAAAIEGKFCDVRNLLRTDAVRSDVRERSSSPATIDYGDESQSPTTSRIEPGQDPKDDSTFLGPFLSVSGFIAPLPRANVDTDCILPKQFCTTILRRGLRDGLFHHWRWSQQGQKDPEFILNRSPYDRASIICAGVNFGCGSSREHAVWALVDFGVRAIFAPSFGDIFYVNSFKNGLLLGIMSETGMLALKTEADAGRQVEVILRTQQVLNESGHLISTFDVDQDLKEMLMMGIDEIGRTLQSSEAIAMYEKVRCLRLPWLDAALTHEWESAKSSIRKVQYRHLEPTTKTEDLSW